METTRKNKKRSNKKPAHKFSSPWHFSDVVLVVEDTKFYVHKCLLSMWSPVFEKMFTSEFSERNAKEIPLPEKHADEVEQLLKVIYSDDAKQQITDTNYEFLLELTREYQMDKVQQHCAQYMMQGIDDQNCLHRYNIAERFGLEDVMEKCNEEARFKSSTDLEESDDFHDLGFESKFKLCMARVKDLEKTLTNYAKICSVMVSGYYGKLDSNGRVKKGGYGQCVYKVSHEYHSPYPGRSYRVQKDFDSSCWYCRNRIGSCKSTLLDAISPIEFDDLFNQLYDLEYDDKVAKIIKNMN